MTKEGKAVGRGPGQGKGEEFSFEGKRLGYHHDET